jgi:flagellar motor switch protein FliM
MTQLPSGNIVSDVIRRITSRLGPARPMRQDPVAAVDYDWRQCHHYGPNAMAKLKETTSKAAAAIAEKLTDLFHAKPDISVDSVSQLFAREAISGSDSAGAWILQFNRQKGKACGILTVSSATALKWVAQLLGDDNSKSGAARGLSELEETLLLDIAFAMGQSFTQSFGAAGGAAISTGTQFAKGSDLQIDPFADVCKMTLGIKTAAGDGTMDIVLLCDVLDPMLGADAQTSSTSPERAKAAILDAIKPSSVSIETVFGHSSISIKDMVELKAGDVIILDKTVGESIEVYLDGRALCLGQLAEYEGRYAIVTEQAFTTVATK